MNVNPNERRTAGQVVAIVFTILCFFLPAYPLANYYSGPRGSSEGYTLNKMQSELKEFEDDIDNMDSYYKRELHSAMKSFDETSSHLSIILVVSYGFILVGIILFCVMVHKYNNYDREGFWYMAFWSLSMFFGYCIVAYFYIHLYNDDIVNSSLVRTMGLRGSEMGLSPIFLIVTVGIITAYFMERHARKVVIQESNAFDEQQREVKAEQRRAERAQSEALAAQQAERRQSNQVSQKSQPRKSSFASIVMPKDQQIVAPQEEKPQTQPIPAQPTYKRFCMFCGTQISPESKFCHMCGKEQIL